MADAPKPGDVDAALSLHLSKLTPERRDAFLANAQALLWGAAAQHAIDSGIGFFATLQSIASVEARLDAIAATRGCQPLGEGTSPREPAALPAAQVSRRP